MYIYILRMPIQDMLSILLIMWVYINAVSNLRYGNFLNIEKTFK